MRTIVQEEYFSPEQCRANPRNLYVFGDNVDECGLGGQACIREEPNSIGVCTKERPDNEEDAFFKDNAASLAQLLDDLGWLSALAAGRFSKGHYDNLVLPADGLGTGFAELDKRAPRLFQILKLSLGLLANDEA